MEFNNSKRMELINTMVTELPVLRARIGASQADISEKIGISRQTYNAIHCCPVHFLLKKLPE